MYAATEISTFFWTSQINDWIMDIWCFSYPRVYNMYGRFRYILLLIELYVIWYTVNFAYYWVEIAYMEGL